MFLKKVDFEKLMQTMIKYTAFYFYNKVVCGGVINDSRGTIRPLDRNGDGVRDNNQDCWWSLALAEGQMLELNFVHIRLFDPDSGSCQYSDYIEVGRNFFLL